MKSIQQILYMLAIGAGILSVQACSKTDVLEQPKTASDISAGEDLVLAEQLFGELKNIADEGESGSFESFKKSSGFAECAEVTRDSNNGKFTIDFGPVYCMCKDGRLRKGRLEVKSTGAYWQRGSLTIIEPNNYFVNTYQVMGKVMVINKGIDGKGNPSWDINADGKIIKPDNKGEIAWKSNRNYTQIRGEATPLDWMDDEWDIRGKGDLTTSNDVFWQIDIIQPLHRTMSCRFIDKGKLRMFRPGINDRIIDFGDGTCDNQVTLIIASQNIDFSLN